MRWEYYQLPVCSASTVEEAMEAFNKTPAGSEEEKAAIVNLAGFYVETQ